MAKSSNKIFKIFVSNQVIMIVTDVTIKGQMCDIHSHIMCFAINHDELVTGIFQIVLYTTMIKCCIVI